MFNWCDEGLDHPETLLRLSLYYAVKEIKPEQIAEMSPTASNSLIRAIMGMIPSWRQNLSPTLDALMGSLQRNDERLDLILYGKARV